MYWEKKEKPKKHTPLQAWAPPYQRSSSINIEMTSYALMAMIGDGTNPKAIADAMPIAQWITKQRNELGGFSSTQVKFLTLPKPHFKTATCIAHILFSRIY